MSACKHCQHPKVYKRDLCHNCYHRPEVLVLYPTKPGYYGHKNDFNGGYELPEPTKTLPGTARRMAEYRRRIKRKQALHHPLDARREL